MISSNFPAVATVAFLVPFSNFFRSKKRVR